MEVDLKQYIKTSITFLKIALLSQIEATIQNNPSDTCWSKAKRGRKGDNFL